MRAIDRARCVLQEALLCEGTLRQRIEVGARIADAAQTVRHRGRAHQRDEAGSKIVARFIRRDTRTVRSQRSRPVDVAFG